MRSAGCFDGASTNCDTVRGIPVTLPSSASRVLTSTQRLTTRLGLSGGSMVNSLIGGAPAEPRTFVSGAVPGSLNAYYVHSSVVQFHPARRSGAESFRVIFRKNVQITGFRGAIGSDQRAG